MTMARKVGVGNVRPRLVRCADGERVDITEALEAERARRAAAEREARREKARGIMSAVAGGCFAAMFIIVAIVWAVSWFQGSSPVTSW